MKQNKDMSSLKGQIKFLNHVVDARSLFRTGLIGKIPQSTERLQNTLKMGIAMYRKEDDLMQNNDPLELYKLFLEGIQCDSDLDFHCSNNYFNSLCQGGT